MRRSAFPYAISAIVACLFFTGVRGTHADTIQIPLVTAFDVTATTTADTALTIFLDATSTTDGAVLAYAVASGPLHGSLGAPEADGSILYTPESGYSGSDSFTYTATQRPVFSSNIATISITISPATPTDTTPPVITAPATQSFATTTFPAFPVLTRATATDETDPSPTITYEPLAFSAGTTTVHWTATDASGNSASTTSLVVVSDATIPTPPADPLPVPTPPSPGPAGNGPPVGYLPTPSNPAMPPVVETTSPAPLQATAPATPLPAPETSAIETGTTADNAAAAHAVVQTPEPQRQSTTLQTQQSQPREPQKTVASGQVAAAAMAFSSAHTFNPWDYAALFILLFLLAGFFAWRLWRRDDDQREAL
jgi:hypothetical protein